MGGAQFVLGTAGARALTMGSDLRSGMWRDPFAPRESRLKSGIRFVAITAAHLALVAVVAVYAVDPEVREATKELVVRLIEPPPKVEEPKPRPPEPVKREAPRLPAPPPPVMTAAAEAPAAPAFAVAPQPPAPPAPPPIQAAPPAPPAITAARFDADYLHNPKPVYPVFSRRQGEEGKVVLRVRVSAEGAALEVEVKQSSGFPRLDAAARDAVSRWRFVPAKQGDAAIEAWVGVPIVFKLDSNS